MGTGMGVMVFGAWSGLWNGADEVVEALGARASLWHGIQGR